MKPWGWQEFSGSKSKWASNFFQIVESASGEKWNFLFATEHNEVFPLFFSMATAALKFLPICPNFPLESLAWTQRRMKIVTLLFENQTKWKIKIKRISMLAEVSNENVIYFHSALLLTKTGFVQKTRPEITKFFWNPQKLEFSLNSLFFMQQFFRFCLAENRHNFSIFDFWLALKSTQSHLGISISRDTKFHKFLPEKFAYPEKMICDLQSLLIDWTIFICKKEEENNTQ